MAHESAGLQARPARRQEPSSRAETIALAVGMTLFIVGVIALVAIFVIHALGGGPITALYVVSLLCPLGLTVAVFTTIANGSRRRRR
ncbi:hypothetical protein ONR57_22170 [Hoyosella sp. YIM 151337]|uniref:hypothetical protein n=1 Tax=Hoyosella sp. YIM 151337 TaxID=2992742 RepID=UPI002236045E|nr:hypothetical protein [Hoyosella sp. YIM 151337]MCW4356018.1 hypothetical protein [Hoyosella sp. YIM 151337]